MNCPDIAILTSSDDNIVSDTQHGVDTVRVTRELVTMKTILVLATITLLSISNICISHLITVSYYIRCNCMKQSQ